jgi:hypothetical protein
MAKLINSNQYLAKAETLHATVVRRSAETSIFEGAKLSSKAVQNLARSSASSKKLARGCCCDCVKM